MTIILKPDAKNVSDLELTRRRFADQIRRVVWKRHRVRLPDGVCSGFAVVPREAFLGDPPWVIRGNAKTSLWGRVVKRFLSRPQAGDSTTDNPRQLYGADVIVAIDANRGLNNGQPSGLALWLHALELKPGDRVLHVGCGLGYYTAIIATVVGPTGRVLAVEVDPRLATRARENLRSCDGVEVIAADGCAYDPGPVDAILVTAGVTHPRKAWLERLRLAGRLVLPLTDDSGTGMMLKITREEGGYTARWISSLIIFDCIGGRDAELSRRLRTGFARGNWRSVQSLRVDSHLASADCWLHADEFCLSTSMLTLTHKPHGR